MLPLWCCNCNRNQPLLTLYNRNRLQEIACNRTRNHRFVIDPMPGIYPDHSHTFHYRSDYSPHSGVNSYKAGNDDVFSLFHAETD